MANNIKNKKNVINQASSKQAGFAILMGLLVLVLGAAAWYGTAGNMRTEQMKSELQSNKLAELQRIKQKMLAYAVLNPELFDDDVADNTHTSIPGIGYFPCPDANGDGISSTGWNCLRPSRFFAMGWIPHRNVAQHVPFLSTQQPIETRRYWFAVDTRFVVDNQRMAYARGLTVSRRFAPLNLLTPSLVDTAGVSNCDETVPPPTCVRPLTLDDRDEDIVMILFYAGDPIDIGGRYRDINRERRRSLEIPIYLEQPDISTYNWNQARRISGRFISKGNGVDPFNDIVIAITREEWDAVMLSRVARDEDRDLNENGLLDAEEDLDGDGFPDGNPVPDGVPDLCVLVNANVSVKQKNSWFNECRYDGGSPPRYDCANTPGQPTNIEGQNWRDALGCPL